MSWVPFVPAHTSETGRGRCLRVTSGAPEPSRRSGKRRPLRRRPFVERPNEDPVPHMERVRTGRSSEDNRNTWSGVRVGSLSETPTVGERFSIPVVGDCGSCRVGPRHLGSVVRVPTRPLPPKKKKTEDDPRTLSDSLSTLFSRKPLLEAPSPLLSEKENFTVPTVVVLSSLVPGP